MSRILLFSLCLNRLETLPSTTFLPLTFLLCGFTRQMFSGRREFVVKSAMRNGGSVCACACRRETRCSCESRYVMDITAVVNIDKWYVFMGNSEGKSPPERYNHRGNYSVNWSWVISVCLEGRGWIKSETVCVGSKGILFKLTVNCCFLSRAVPVTTEWQQDDVTPFGLDGCGKTCP